MARRIRGARPLFGLHDHEIIVDLFAGGVVGQPLDRGVGTVTGVDHHSLVLIYARFPDGRIEGFDGHRVLVDVQVRSENYLKDSSLSGAEVRAWVQVEISFNRKKVYRFGRRSAERALFDAQWAIDRLFNLPVHVWREEELERWLGRVIAYHGRPMAVHGWDLDQGRVVLATQPSDGREPVVVGVDLLDGGIRWFGDC